MTTPREQLAQQMGVDATSLSGLDDQQVADARAKLNPTLPAEPAPTDGSAGAKGRAEAERRYGKPEQRPAPAYLTEEGRRAYGYR